VKPKKSGSVMSVHVSMSPTIIRLTRSTKTPKRSKGTKALRKTCSHASSAAMETRMRMCGSPSASTGSSSETTRAHTKVVVPTSSQLSMRPMTNSSTSAQRTAAETRRFSMLL